MFEFTKLGAFLVSPLTVTFALASMAVLFALLRRKGLATGLALMAFCLLWLASTPAIGFLLARPLEAQFPAVPVEAAPEGDVILVLGGALSVADPPRRPTFNMGPAAGRIWHAAQLYRAHKARWVVIAGGNQPGHEDQQPEANAISEILVKLGVPPEAIRIESASRNTRENARNVQPLIRELGAQRVLLVTSALHMPRALKIFKKQWKELSILLIPISADVVVTEHTLRPKMWIPNAFALGFVTRTIKEYAGAIAVTMM